jgi:hypothetical protein
MRVHAVPSENIYMNLVKLSLYFQIGSTTVHVKGRKWKIFVFVPEQPALSSWVLAFNLQKLKNFIGFSFYSLKI